MVEIALVAKQGDGHVAHRSSLPQRYILFHPPYFLFCFEQFELVANVNWHQKAADTCDS